MTSQITWKSEKKSQFSSNINATYDVTFYDDTNWQANMDGFHSDVIKL